MAIRANVSEGHVATTGHADRGKFNSEFLTYENTLVLRAFAVILIIFAHVQYWAGFYFSNMASIMVGLFFFLSGYGLTISKITKPDYLTTFNRRRWSSVVIPTVTTSVLGFCIYVLYGAGNTGNMHAILYRIFINPISGFIYQLLVFYIIFYISNRFFKEKDALVLIWAGSILLLVAKLFGHNLDYNHENSFLFAIGATVAVYNDILYGVTSRNYNKVLLLIGGLFFLACVNFSMDVRYDSTYNFVTTAAVLFLILLIMKKPEHSYRTFALIFFILVVMYWLWYWFWPNINMGGLNIMRDIFLIACISSVLNYSSGNLRKISDTIGSSTLEMYLIHWSLFPVVWPITSGMGSLMPILTTLLMLVFTLSIAIPMHYLNSYQADGHKRLAKRIWKSYDVSILYVVTVLVILFHYVMINIL